MNVSLPIPAVSVVVAARDNGCFLADTLGSVQRQTFTNWELILIDDGSRDDTAAVVQPFLHDPRFRYIPSDNLGPTRAKNLAFRHSRAPLIALLDGDDVWLPTKLERQVRLLDAEPEVGAVFCRRFLIDPQGGLLPSTDFAFHRGAIFDDVLLDNFICYSSVLLRREILDHVGSFDDRLDLALDYDLWLRAAKHYRFDYIDEPLVKYRTGHGNLSRRIIDRLTIVLSIMRRSLIRRGNAEHLPPNVQRQAWGSTCRTMAYVQRDQSPAFSVRWYVSAAMCDRGWLGTLRACVRSAWRGLTKRS